MCRVFGRIGDLCIEISLLKACQQSPQLFTMRESEIIVWLCHQFGEEEKKRNSLPWYFFNINPYSLGLGGNNWYLSVTLKYQVNNKIWSCPVNNASLCRRTCSFLPLIMFPFLLFKIIIISECRTLNIPYSKQSFFCPLHHYLSG